MYGENNDLGEMGAESGGLCSRFLLTSHPHSTKGLIQNPCHLAGPNLANFWLFPRERNPAVALKSSASSPWALKRSDGGSIVSDRLFRTRDSLVDPTYSYH